MNRVRLALFVLVLASLACGQYVPENVTPLPTPFMRNTPSVTPPANLRVTPTAEPVQTTAVNQIAVVLPALVNVRAEPGGEVVGQLSEGDSVTILLCDGEWCKIQYEQTTGYVFAGCLSFNPSKLGCSAR